MPDKNIFCNSPWYELHIYWDGGLGFCCQESHRLYSSDQSARYNIRNMSIREWYDSQVMRQARLSMHGNDKISFCSRCYHEELISGTSRRHKCNQKSAIFTKTNFKESYEQSPGFNKFQSGLDNQGAYSGMPIDLHIDLGNYCNLTCKMCWAGASSSIAVQQVKWGIENAKQYVGSDWTKDELVWSRVLEELVNIPNLHNIHFMGGETLLTPRFEQFVDYMIAHNRFDLHFSFVTNGTVFNQQLLDKLKKFRRVGIEVSIESLTDHNRYQRQGTDTNTVLDNIQRYIENSNNSSITVTLRPTISALTIGSYHTLLSYALDKQLLIKNLVVIDPEFLNPQVLPESVRLQYLNSYQKLQDRLSLDRQTHHQDYNESDPNEYQEIILNQITQCLHLLTAPRLDNYESLMSQLVKHCKKWDLVHGYNALELYPELVEEFKHYGY
jgi:MoaA/NifB/PqqE/SkfB family radical SAM enzyme